MDELKDIKPLVEIPDNSLMYLIILVFVIVLVLICIAVIWYFIINKPKAPPSKQQVAIRVLSKLDFKNSKDVAYCFTTHGKYLINEQNNTQFVEIEQQLNDYKYKKQVNALDSKLITNIKEFIRV